MNGQSLVFRSSYHSRLPQLGVTSRMKDSGHEYLLARETVENGKRKATNNDAPEIAIDDGERLRIANDSQQRFVNAIH